MSNMVYLMTSLPSLTFGQVPPISIEEFKQDASKQLSGRHYRALEAVDIQLLEAKQGGVKSITSLLDDVQNDLLEVRNTKAYNRQPKLNRIPKNVIAGNPLEREQNMMKWQWEELDSIEAGKTFTLTEVLVYKLKLQILIRLHSFNEAKGAEVLASVVNPSSGKEKK